jgi:hypothetical protein
MPNDLSCLTQPLPALAGRLLCGGLNRRLKEMRLKGGGFHHNPPSAD